MQLSLVMTGLSSTFPSSLYTIAMPQAWVFANTALFQAYAGPYLLDTLISPKMNLSLVEAIVICSVAHTLSRSTLLFQTLSFIFGFRRPVNPLVCIAIIGIPSLYLRSHLPLLLLPLIPIVNEESYDSIGSSNYSTKRNTNRKERRIITKQNDRAHLRLQS